jgi:hypothetical protein
MVSSLGGLYWKLRTYHLTPLFPASYIRLRLFSPWLHRCKEYVHRAFLNIFSFTWRGVTNLRSDLENHPLSSILGSLFRIFIATLLYLEAASSIHNLDMTHAPWQGTTGQRCKSVCVSVVTYSSCCCMVEVSIAPYGIINLLLKFDSSSLRREGSE